MKRDEEKDGSRRARKRRTPSRLGTALLCMGLAAGMGCQATTRWTPEGGFERSVHGYQVGGESLRVTQEIDPSTQRVCRTTMTYEVQKQGLYELVAGLAAGWLSRGL